MTTLSLSKLHATGNDFLVLTDLTAEHGPPGDPTLSVATRVALCDRRRGIGADGLIRLLPGTDGADCTMELTNADGGLAEISGNGLRTLAWAAARAGLVRGERLVVDTGAGRRVMDLRLKGGEVVWAVVDMGPVTFEPADIPVDVASPFDLEVLVDGTVYRGDAAGVGNPHFITVVDDPSAVPVERHGPLIEHDPRFPHRTNVEFVAVVPGGLRMRVWERGVGETLSCGSGASAAAAAAHRRGLVGERSTVTVPGGVLELEVGATVRLGGPVHHVFDVEVDLEKLVESADGSER